MEWKCDGFSRLSPWNGNVIGFLGSVLGMEVWFSGLGPWNGNVIGFLGSVLGMEM